MKSDQAGKADRRMNIGKLGFARFQSMFMEIFGLGRAAAFSAVLLTGAVLVLGLVWFFRSAPPDTITMTSGPEGSIFQNNAQKYRQILARNRVTLKVLPSQGSQENLRRLNDPSYRVDIGFVQGGLAQGVKIDKLASLGSISYVPLLVFYRNPVSLDILSQFEGKRLAIGPEGSGTRALSLNLLAMNGIKPGGETVLVDLDADDAARALIERKVDAAFMTGDSASLEILRGLLQADGIRLFDFIQSEGYSRRVVYLNRLEFPQGAVDFGRNIPGRDIRLVAPTVELIARTDLHPALSDLLLEAAQEVHGRAGLFKKRGEFPAPLEQEFPISPEALRFYKSGKSFFYRILPFWVASMVSRALVVIVPVLVVLIPGFRFIPALYQWRMRLRIYRWYRILLALEQELLAQSTPERCSRVLKELDEIERSVNRMKVPASFADQFYILRGHIGFVRDRLTSGDQPC